MLSMAGVRSEVWSAVQECSRGDELSWYMEFPHTKSTEGGRGTAGGMRRSGSNRRITYHYINRGLEYREFSHTKSQISLLGTHTCSWKKSLLIINFLYSKKWCVGCDNKTLLKLIPLRCPQWPSLLTLGFWRTHQTPGFTNMRLVEAFEILRPTQGFGSTRRTQAFEIFRLTPTRWASGIRFWSVASDAWFQNIASGAWFQNLVSDGY